MRLYLFCLFLLFTSAYGLPAEQNTFTDLRGKVTTFGRKVGVKIMVPYLKWKLSHEIQKLEDLRFDVKLQSENVVRYTRKLNKWVGHEVKTALQAKIAKQMEFIPRDIKGLESKIMSGIKVKS